jgi:hypothetical protein
MTHIIIDRVKLEKILEVLEENHHLIEEHERSEYLALYDRQITAIKQALAAHPPQRTEQNFCERCGKRTKDLTHIHTCTPPMEKNT